MKPFARPPHLPAFVQNGAAVWYESLPGNVFSAIITDQPRQLCDGEWVAKIYIIETCRTNIVAVDALAPRRAGSYTPLHEFIAIFFGVDVTNPEAA